MRLIEPLIDRAVVRKVRVRSRITQQVRRIRGLQRGLHVNQDSVVCRVTGSVMDQTCCEVSRSTRWRSCGCEPADLVGSNFDLRTEINSTPFHRVVQIAVSVKGITRRVASHDELAPSADELVNSQILEVATV